MIINDVVFNVELMDILTELIRQLRENHIDLISKYKEGKDHVQICCPYHNNGQEKRPSAGIRKSDGMFHCFACNEVHSLPEVISHCFGYDDVLGSYGWGWLLQHFATVTKEERKDVALDFSRANTSVSDSRLGDSDRHKSFVTEEELARYRLWHPYMYKRGLTDDVIELFDIGYDAATDCITFPVRDIKGRCLFVARRSVKTKWFNYPRGVVKPLYGLYEIEQQRYKLENDDEPYDGFNATRYDDVVVCESMLDALSFWVVGKHAVALNGLGNELQFRQLRELPCRKIVLATDMDERGLAARTRIRQNVPNKLITEYLLPEGRKDANECTQEELKNLFEVF